MKIDIGIDRIDRIYHLADIHLRNVKRHKEYRQIFEKFYKDVEERGTENSIIYIAGDLVHAKLEISPELVRELSTLLKRCAELCPTVVIAGNHDTNLNNAHRLDALTPIIENLNDPNVIYLRDSGVYEIANRTFIVYGVFDINQQENWPEIPETDNFKIGLFHGPIHNSVTDVGFVVSNRSVNRDSFDGCDMVLCGDIHKRQLLSTENPLIAYAGSMIQQSHGEALDGHGYIVWNLWDNHGIEEFNGKTLIDGDFVDIENDWGYYTLDINNGKVPKVDDMPKFPRLRVRIYNTSVAKVKRALTRVRKLYDVKEFTVTRMDALSKIRSGQQNANINVGDVTNVDFQKELINDYLSRQYPVDGDTLKDIEVIHNDLNSRLPDEEIIRNVNWRPIKFEFSNMFSYGEDNVITFEGMDGIYGLFAPNATGKSSLFDAISFCLFDKCSRAFKASHIMNNRKSKFKCVLEFEIDNIIYFIKREAKTVRKGEHVKVDVEFWKIDENGNEITLNGEHRRSTNDVIRQYIGTYDDFVLTALSLQNQNAIFIDKSQSERKDLLAQFMGINVFDKLYTLASEDIMEVKSMLRKMKKEDYEGDLADVLVKLDEGKEKYKEIEGNLELEKKRKQLSEKMKLELVHKLVKIDSKIQDIDALNKNMTTLQNDLKITSKDVGEKTNEIKVEKRKLKKVEESFEELKKSDIVSKYEQYNEIKTKHDRLKDKIDHITDDIQTKQKQLDSYNKASFDSNCDFCVRNMEEFNNTAFVLAREINSLEDDISTLTETYSDYDKYVNDHYKVKEEYDRYHELEYSFYNLSADVARSEASLSKLEQHRSQVESMINDVKAKIREHHLHKDTIKKNNDLQKSIDKYNAEIKEYSDKIDECNSELLQLHGEITSLESEQKWYNSQLDTLLDLENKFKTYEYYLDAVKRDGVPYELIAKVLPVIEGEVNNILQQIVDFGMNLEIDGKNINGKIVYEDRSWPLEMCSGMERFISGLAIRVALINICNLPRPNFLVLDEGFGTLDHNNIAAMFMLFTYLKSQFDFIMIISHLDAMRDVVDDLIELKSVDGFTYVRI